MMHFSNFKRTTYIVIVLLIVGFVCSIVGFMYMEQEEQQPHYISIDTLIEQLNQEELLEQEQIQVDKQESSIIKQPLEQEVKISTEVLAMEEPTNTNAELDSSVQALKVNINTATAEELQQLKGIGPSKAKAIIEERERGGPFKTIEDIRRVKGIGDKIFQTIKESLVN